MKRSCMWILGLICFLTVTWWTIPNQVIRGESLQSQEYALSFDGGDRVTIPNHSSLNPSHITVECWVKFNRLAFGPGYSGTDSQFPMCKGGDRTAGAYRFQQGGHSASSFWISFGIGRFWNSYGAGTSFPASFKDCWCHLAGTYDGNIIKFYLNGILKGTKEVGTIPVGNSSPLYFSYDDVGGFPYYLDGCMDEVRIWDYARTEEEIQAYMNVSLSGNEPGLVGYWQLEEGSDQIVSDLTINNNDGYLGSSSGSDSNDPAWISSEFPIPNNLCLELEADFSLYENTSSEVTTTENIVVHNSTLSGASVEGDLNGTIDFLQNEIMYIVSGSFADEGFFKGTWAANLEGASYSGDYRGVAFLDSSEDKVNLKGSFSGDLSGVQEGYLEESIQGSSIYNQYYSTWRLCKSGTEVISGTLQIIGSLSYQDAINIQTDLDIYQSQLEGNAYGRYTGPLSAILTRMCVSGQNEYEGEGFSIISYTSDLGSGVGWCYNNSYSVMEGMFGEPLHSRLQAYFYEGMTPKALIGFLNPIDAGEIPQPKLAVDIWGPKRVSPGQTIDYIIEYRNEGLISSDSIIIVSVLDHLNILRGSSVEAVFDTFYSYVSWEFTEILPKTEGRLSYTVEIPWGLPSGEELHNSCYIIEKSPLPMRASVHDIEIPNLIISGINTPLGSPGDIIMDQLAELINATRVPCYMSGIWWLDCIDVQLAALGIQNHNNGLLWFSNFGKVTTNDCIAHSGGTRTALTAILNGTLECNRLILISPMSGAGLPGHWLTEIEQVLSTNPNMEIVIYQSRNDYAANRLTELIVDNYIYQVRFDASDIGWLHEWDNIKVNPNTEEFGFLEPIEIGGKIINIDQLTMNSMDHWGIFLYIFNLARGIIDNETISHHLSMIAVARDPNIKYGCQGHVIPGQNLNYTIEYENEGEGIAFGVYITDVLDEDLEEATLIINNDGTYDFSTSTITWFIGQVDPHEGGTVSFTADLRGDAVPGTEVINYATVYFPSVPEVTVTNAVVCRVACEQPILALVGYSTVSWTDPLWEVQVEVNNAGSGVAKKVNVTMNSDITWLIIPDPYCSYGDIPEGISSNGNDSYVFDLTNHPGGSFSVWFDVTYEDECGNQNRLRLDPEFNADSKDSEIVDVACFKLIQNYPNPFNPNTTINFQLPERCQVHLRVYNIAGKLIKILVNEYKEPGIYAVAWDGRDNSGTLVASGIYFYRLVAGDFIQTKKMVLLR